MRTAWMGASLLLMIGLAAPDASARVAEDAADAGQIATFLGRRNAESSCLFFRGKGSRKKSKCRKGQVWSAKSEKCVKERRKRRKRRSRFGGFFGAIGKKLRSFGRNVRDKVRGWGRKAKKGWKKLKGRARGLFGKMGRFLRSGIRKLMKGGKKGSTPVAQPAPSATAPPATSAETPAASGAPTAPSPGTPPSGGTVVTAPTAPSAPTAPAPGAAPDSEAARAALRAAPSCRFRKGARPSETLGRDVTGVRDAKTGQWLDPTKIPVEKIVVLMLENRSFDHYYGRLPQYLKRKFPNHPGAKAGGIDVPPEGASNPVDISKPNGKKVPFHRAKMLCHSDTNHEWWGSHFQWNGGKMNGFVQSNEGFWEAKMPQVAMTQLGGERAMSYYDDREIPFYYKLAATFAIGDRYFSSLIGPTWPNRDFLYGATSRGLTYNSAVETKADLARDLMKDPAIIIDQLNAKKIPWRFYIDGDAITSRIPRFGSFTGPLGLVRRLYPGVEAKLRDFWAWMRGLPDKLTEWVASVGGMIKRLQVKAAYDFLKAKVDQVRAWVTRLRTKIPQAAKSHPIVVQVRSGIHKLIETWGQWKILSLSAISGGKKVYAAAVELRDKLVNAGRSIDKILRGTTSHFTQFLADARAGKLPAVTFVDPNVREDVNSTDEHPPAVVQFGQRFTWQIVDALMRGPDWNKTALIITYDEHGGYYDHVPPPKACAPDAFTGDANKFTTAHPGNGGIKHGGHGAVLDVKFPGAFDRLGIRVPLIVVSPWAKKNYVSHKVYDHTSVLRFIQAKFNLPALSNRDANASALFDLFDFSNYKSPSKAPSASAKASHFSEPPIDQARLAECRKIFPPAEGLKRLAMGIAKTPYKESSIHNDAKMAQRVCGQMEPGVCDWSRSLPGAAPHENAHFELPLPQPE